MVELPGKKIKKKANKFLLGVIIGSAVGSILGLTMAPKTGREMRGEIAKHSKKTWGKMEKVIEKNSRSNRFWEFLHKIFIGTKKNKKKDED